MTQAHREHLSAGIDGELAREELRFLLRRFEHDAELRGAWARYHMARDGLRRQLPAVASGGFATRVEQAIAREQQTGAGRRVPHWLRWSTGGAIAAGVAVAALMIARPAGEGEHAPADLTAQAVQSTATAPLAQPAAPAAVPPWLSADTASQYSQQAAATLGESYGTAAMRPYARSLSPYRLQSVRSLDNSGGYLLLVDPQQAVRPPRQAAGAQ
ncbi:sigma-E factor negative regulatory protein [Fulvimonas yonginensis]|uniref:Sigma-E factor negative regulatory protein n=1 Tax=Fulvimonas yonginensis TaxID=1495200 RepID=A0ABU8JH29_9GAMM